MIYLNRVAQERVAETFHFALKPGGFLFLGSSESVDGSADLYSSFNREHHIFQSRKVRSRSYPVPEAVPALQLDHLKLKLMPQMPEIRSQERVSYGELHQKLLEEYAPPSLVVDTNYDIVHVSEQAGRYLQIAGGELSQNLLRMILPELRLELRSALFQATEQKRPVKAKAVSVNNGEPGEAVSIQVRPVGRYADSPPGFILVLFETVSSEELQATQELLITSNGPVTQILEDELTRMKAQLRGTIEQYEFQGEELKASNEELQAMNEELRSAAEELETSREELQSINEELRTVNQELKVKIEETSLSSNNLQNLLNSSNIATIFLDRRFRVALFTPAIRDIFNLIGSDYGRPITDITNRLLSVDLMKDAEAVLENLHAVEREVNTSDNRFYMMRLLPYRTNEDHINGVVITFFDITQRRLAEDSLRQSEEQLKVSLNNVAADLAGMTRLYNLNERLLSAPSLDNALQEILAVAVDFSGMDRGHIQLLQKDGKTLSMGVHQGHGAAFVNHFLNAGPAPVFCNFSITNGERFVVEDIHNETSFSKEPDLGVIKNDDIVSLQCIPLTSHGGKKLGVLVTCDSEARKLPESALRLLDLLAWMAADFIERTIAEEGLRQSEDRFRTLTDAVPQVIWANDAKGTANYFNQRWYDYTGLTYDESFAKGWQAVVHPDDAPVSNERWASALAEGKIFDSEYRLRNADGVYRWHIGRNVPLRGTKNEINGWVGSATDIEDIKKAGESLRASEERLKITMDSAADYAIISMDTRGFIQAWSSGAEKTFGFTEIDVLGVSADIIFTPEDIAAGVPAAEMQTAMETGRAADERWHMRKDGTRFFMSGVMAPIRDNSGVLSGFVKVARDMTGPKKLEQQKDEFIAVASHELKTPVTSIKAYVEILREMLEHDEGKSAAEIIIKLDGQVSRLTDLIHELLDTTQMAEGQLLLHKEEFDLNGLVNETLDGFQRFTDHKISFVAGPIKLLYADQERIGQVITNLLSNAIKYSPGGGQVSISTDDLDDSVRLTISDNGVGIARSMLPKVFDRFFRVSEAGKQTFPGIGLGLYISAGIIYRHGGTIAVDSQLGKGSVFSFTLPYH